MEFVLGVLLLLIGVILGIIGTLIFAVWANKRFGNTTIVNTTVTNPHPVEKLYSGEVPLTKQVPWR